MREILFRGKIGKDWVYGGYCKDSNGTYIMTNDLSISQHTKVKSVSVGQHTGFKDINGVEIFEGDIVKTESLYDDHSQKGAIAIKVVKFWCGSYHLCELNQDSGANLFEVLTVSRAEVIGNIYDNQELLEKR